MATNADMNAAIAAYRGHSDLTVNRFRCCMRRTIHKRELSVAWIKSVSPRYLTSNQPHAGCQRLAWVGLMPQNTQIRVELWNARVKTVSVPETLTSYIAPAGFISFPAGVSIFECGKKKSAQQVMPKECQVRPAELNMTASGASPNALNILRLTTAGSVVSRVVDSSFQMRATGMLSGQLRSLYVCRDSFLFFGGVAWN